MIKFLLYGVTERSPGAGFIGDPVEPLGMRSFSIIRFCLYAISKSFALCSCHCNHFFTRYSDLAS